MQEELKVDVWHWPLTFSGDATRARHVDLLSPDETQRANKLLSSVHRDEFISARAGLRCVVAEVLQTDAASLIFSYGPHGKPFLETPEPDTPLHFNLAHTRTRAILAISRDCDIGADIEQHRDVDLGLAKRYFTENEWQIISLAEAPRQRELFFRCWTLKEAILKATGDGIQGGLDSFEVSLDDRPARVLHMNGSDPAQIEWSLQRIDLAPDTPGAVAVPRGNVKLDLRQQVWSPA